MKSSMTRLLAATLACWTSAALALPELPGLPFEARTEWVLPAGRIAGRTVSIAQFDTELDMDRAIAETLWHWRRESRFDVLEGTSGQWRTLSRHDGSSTITLQIQSRASGGSHGLISVWAKQSSVVVARADGAERRLRSLMPASSVGVQTFSSIDADRVAVTLVATIEGPLTIAWTRLLAAIRAGGFEQSREVSLPAPFRNTRAAAFRRQAEEMMVTMDARSEQLGVVIHLIEAKP